jgi:phage FluMu protein Com
MNDTSNNRIIICIDCHKPFVFSEGEQAFYLEHKLVEPKRCPECRRLNKIKKEAKGNG